MFDVCPLESKQVKESTLLANGLNGRSSLVYLCFLLLNLCSSCDSVLYVFFPEVTSANTTDFVLCDIAKVDVDTNSYREKLNRHYTV